MRYLALLLLVGCAHVGPLCEVDGVTFWGTDGEPTEGWTCDDFRSYMSTIKSAFDEHATDWRWKAHNFGEALKGYSVQVHRSPAWYSSAHEAVIAGYCQCFTRQIVVSSRPFGLGQGYGNSSSVLAHEISHALEGCYYGPAEEGGTQDHYHWRERGVYGWIEWAHENQMAKEYVACEGGFTAPSCP